MAGQVEVETQFQIPQYQTSQLEAAPQYYFIQAEGPESEHTEVSYIFCVNLIVMFLLSVCCERHWRLW